jgi:Transposase
MGNHRAKPSRGRRAYTKELKEAAVRQLESGIPIGRVSAKRKISATLLRRWLSEFQEYGERAFSGYGRARTSLGGSIKTSLRFTGDEYLRLKEAWSQAGNPTLSDFVRDQVLRATKTEPLSIAAIAVSALELAAAVRKLAATCVSGIARGVGSCDLPATDTLSMSQLSDQHNGPLQIRSDTDSSMPVTKPRNRMIILRITEEEHAQVQAAAARDRARSLSDFARSALLRSMGEPSLAALAQTLQEIRTSVALLTPKPPDKRRK